MTTFSVISGSIAGVLLIILVLRSICKVINKRTKPVIEPLGRIHIIDTVSKCVEAMDRIRIDCSEYYNIVGLNSVWHRYDFRSTRHETDGLILVLCTYRGYCALFRLDKFARIPSSLKDFLASNDIAKVGVGTLEFADQLHGCGIHFRRYYELCKVIIEDENNPLTDEILCIFENRINFNTYRFSQQSINIIVTDAYKSLQIYNQLDPSIVI